MRRQFFSFFIPRLHRQLYRGLCLSASMALRHSSLASRPATELKLLSLPPATHCLMVRYLVLQACSLRHCSLALTQSIRVVLARRFSSAMDSTSANTSGMDEKRLSLHYLLPALCYFCEKARHNSAVKKQHFRLKKTPKNPQVKSDRERSNNFWTHSCCCALTNLWHFFFFCASAALGSSNIIHRKLNL